MIGKAKHKPVSAMWAMNSAPMHTEAQRLARRWTKVHEALQRCQRRVNDNDRTTLREMVQQETKGERQRDMACGLLHQCGAGVGLMNSLLHDTHTRRILALAVAEAGDRSIFRRVV